MIDGRFHEKIKIRFKNLLLHKNIERFHKAVNRTDLLVRENDLKPEIIIPCYNHGRYIETALASAASQGASVTVINDASNDDSLEKILALKEKYDFKLINNSTNLKQSGSVNRAIAESENNLFIMLNADDALLEYTVDTALNIYRANKNFRMLGGGAILVNQETTLKFIKNIGRKLNYLPEIKIFGPRQAIKIKRLNDLNMTMSGSSFLKSAWSAVGGFLPFEQRVCSHDDRDFQLRVCCLFDVAVIDEPLSMYRVGSSVGQGES